MLDEKWTCMLACSFHPWNIDYDGNAVNFEICDKVYLFVDMLKRNICNKKQYSADVSNWFDSEHVFVLDFHKMVRENNFAVIGCWWKLINYSGLHEVNKLRKKIILLF